MEADPQRPVDLEHKLHTSSRPQQSVEGHSLITRHNMAIMTQYRKKPHMISTPMVQRITQYNAQT